jgi:DNA-binding LytR/AlgR family response regulator
MMKIKTLIVDDEPHAIAIIQQYAAEFTELEVIACCHSALQAFRVMQAEPVDLIFLDVKMPGINGIDFIKSLPSPPKVIFTTAYQEFAIDGFDLNAVDYLLKPIPFERFFKAIGKVVNVFKGPVAEERIIKEPASADPSPHYLYLRIDRRVVKIDTNDIIWIESFKDYVKVVLKDQVLSAKQKISVIEKLLPIDGFMRIHRSFIVPLSKIGSYNASYVKVMGKELPIGRHYKADCLQRLRL